MLLRTSLAVRAGARVASRCASTEAQGIYNMLETQRQLAQAMPVSPTPTLASLPLGAYDFRVTQAASASSTPALGHSMTSFQLDSIFCAMPGTSTAHALLLPRLPAHCPRCRSGCLPT
jgi:hypothetical protein